MKRPESMRLPTEREIKTGRLDLLGRIKKQSMFIGSRAWGVETEDSDWDYLIQQEKLNKILLDIEQDHPHCFFGKNYIRKVMVIPVIGIDCMNFSLSL